MPRKALRLDETLNVRVNREQLVALDRVVAAHTRARPGISFSRADAVRMLISQLAGLVGDER